MDYKVMVIALVGVALLGLLAFTGCRRHAPGAHSEMAIDYLAESLDLDDAQQAQLENYRNEIMEQAKQMHSGKKQIFDELVVQINSEAIAARPIGFEIHRADEAIALRRLACERGPLGLSDREPETAA